MDICVHKELCGGCEFQGTAYEEQLKHKENELLSLLRRKEIVCDDVRSIEACPSIYAYRNKMEYTFGDRTKGGPLCLGMHEKGRFMSIVTVDKCMLVPPEFNTILSETLKFCEEKGYRHYHKKTHEGLLRNLIIRKGMRTGELLINIVTSSQGSFDEKAYESMLLKLLPPEGEGPHTVGILHTINDDIADAVKPENTAVLYGRDHYFEELCGLRFKVSAFSFFQTNVAAAERMYLEALSLIESPEGKTAFDLFSGTGTITQLLALKARKAVGVELVEEAVEAARENAAINGLENCSFYAGDVFEVLSGRKTFGNGSSFSTEEKPDLIVVDPPRAGISPKAIEKIASYAVPEILYISCNPKTLAENLYYLQYSGYRVVSVKPYDNYGFTRHLEVVSLLKRVRDSREA